MANLKNVPASAWHMVAGTLSVVMIGLLVTLLFTLRAARTEESGSIEMRVGQGQWGFSLWKSSLPAMSRKATQMVSNRL